MKNISKHISYREATKSRKASKYGIDNTPNSSQLLAMMLVANKIFEPVRNHFGVPIYVSSFFRSPLLNKKIRGSKTSSHLKGEAIDTDDVLGGLRNIDVFNFIKDNLEFDQLIWEYGTDENPAWVHASYSANGNRNQILRAIRYKDIRGRNRTRFITLK